MPFYPPRTSRLERIWMYVLPLLPIHLPVVTLTRIQPDYVGGCTDPSLADPNCNPGCDNLPTLDVVYDGHERQWLCCGADASGNVTCDHPTTETVVAKHVASIATTYVVPSIVSTTSATGAPTSSSTSSSMAGTSTSGASAQSSSAAASAPSMQNSAQHTSHAGAIAGGVIGGLAFIALVATGGYFWYRRRRASNSAPQQYELPTEGYYAPLEKEGVPYERPELATSDAPSVIEMDGLGPLDEARQATKLR